MPNLILDLMVDRVDLVDEGANSEAFIKLYKRKETTVTMTFEEILAKMKPEHAEVIKSQIAKAKADAEAEMGEKVKDAENAKEDAQEQLAKAKQALEEIEVAKRKDAEPDFEEVLKNADPAVQDVFKSIKAQKDAAEEAVRQLNEKAKHEEAVMKAKELKSLPVEEAKLVEVIKGINPEVLEILKSANQAIEQGGLLDEVGKSKGEAGSLGDAEAAWAKIEKKAEEIITRDKVSKAKAVSIAVRENPELYQAYLEGGAN